MDDRTEFFSQPEMQKLFFFSSRRRHTRCLSDWSSDVCSSDLPLGSVSVVVLMLHPFDTAWSATALPALLAYLFVFQRDLKHNGSRALQLFRAMALNAMLLPINLAGAINSLRQLWSGRKIPFQRTPKLQGWTAAALCLCALTLSHATWDVSQSAEPSEIPPREAAVTFDDLPVISVTPIDAAGRTTLTRRLLAKISAWKVPVIGFVNEYGLY